MDIWAHKQEKVITNPTSILLLQAAQRILIGDVTINSSLLPEEFLRGKNLVFMVKTSNTRGGE